MPRHLGRMLALLLVIAGAAFAVAFATARALRDDDGAGRATAPVYYGPPPAIPNLDRAINSPSSLGATPAR